MSGQLHSATLISAATDQSESSIPEILVINRQTNRKTTVDPRMSMLLFSTSSIRSCSGSLFLFLTPSPPPQKHKMTGRTGFPRSTYTYQLDVWVCVCVRVFMSHCILPYRQQQSAEWMPWLTAWVVVQLCMKTNYRATTKRLWRGKRKYKVWLERRGLWNQKQGKEVTHDS